MVKLHLGCGRDIKEGFVNIDHFKGEGVDVVCNLGHEKLPFDDNTIDVVYANSFIEHLDCYETDFLLDELYRVCKPEAIIEFISPHYLAPASSRVWHKQRISEGYFNEYAYDSDRMSLDSKPYFKISYKLTYMRYKPEGRPRFLPFLLILPCNIQFKLKVVKGHEGRKKNEF
ncbi:MAG TPA: methyltransferase domain-containing protein [Candidatus Thermoplasmatota archaeon]|nr:methyltransferase domain-containing protein [Candidatus Thermoplasmatota archaeon]